jgi:hypothetical protein
MPSGAKRPPSASPSALDGERWYKHPQNPVLRPDPQRPWESNYVGSGCVMRLPDGSFRYWYASRKAAAVFESVFCDQHGALVGPSSEVVAARPLRLPPEKGDVGVLTADASGRTSIVRRPDDVIVRAWYDSKDAADETTFVDVWIQGIATKELVANSPLKTQQRVRSRGQQADRHHVREAQLSRSCSRWSVVNPRLRFGRV